MQQNIYFRKHVWDLFKAESDKSDLVNRLLESHYTVQRVYVAAKSKDELNTKLKEMNSYPKEPARAAVQPIVKTKEDVLPAIKQLFPEAKNVTPLFRDKKNKKL